MNITKRTLRIMTWNIEGLKRNVHNLRHFLDLYLPDLVFLSEPQIYGCDIDSITEFFRGEYCYTLNSPDKYDDTLPLHKSKAFGGTAVFWRSELHPFIDIFPVCTPSYLPIICKQPGVIPSVHVAIYLPTAGREKQFINDIAALSNTFDEISTQYPDSPIYLRGDFNVNSKNKSRSELLEHFMRKENLDQVSIQHPTYHHFVGSGLSDSNLDRLMYSKTAISEKLELIVCNKQNPLVDSLHDILISVVTLPNTPNHPPNDVNVNDVAPKVQNVRHRVKWTDDGIEKYQLLVFPHLQRLQQTWLDTSSKSSVELLLGYTNDVLTECAKASNDVSCIPSKPNLKKRPVPLQIRKQTTRVLNLWKKLRMMRSLSAADNPLIIEMSASYAIEKRKLRQLTRHRKALDSYNRDTSLMKNPIATYARIRRARQINSERISHLQVDDKTYYGDCVQDGFFESIKQLKIKKPHSEDDAAIATLDMIDDYHHILQLCKSSKQVPPVPQNVAFDILSSMKSNVLDFYSVTPDHYTNAGLAGYVHFHLLLNALLDDLSNTTITAVNRAYACILFKGHNKDRTSSKSYRTISTCPVIAKGLDLYIRRLCISDWNEDQAPTQFQGENSSHELAAILLTECIQYSRAVKTPLYVLYLDARSAFDVVQREILVKKLFHAQKASQLLLHIDNRLANRETIVD